MTARYRNRGNAAVPDNNCQRKETLPHPACASIPGRDRRSRYRQPADPDQHPLALEVALTAQSEMEARAAEADHWRRAGVEQARPAAELARRRYLAVDVGTRLVAATLEAD